MEESISTTNNQQQTVVENKKSFKWISDFQATGFLFLCITLTFFILCIWAAANNNLATVPFALCALFSHNISLAKRLNAK